jgi:hypothetical protein
MADPVSSATDVRPDSETMTVAEGMGSAVTWLVTRTSTTATTWETASGGKSRKRT